MALFRITNNKTKKLSPTQPKRERDLQRLFENNLQTLLNITFLASEYVTSSGGRIDTLGIDNNGAPVIVEYKLHHHHNVINQGLSYLRWLLDHKADFEKLVSQKNISLKIDWDSPRVICIAVSYNKFDLDTVDLLPIKIELLRYQFYQDDLLLLEPEHYRKTTIATHNLFKKSSKPTSDQLQKTYTLEDHLQQANSALKSLFLNLREKILSLDDNIIEEPKKLYIAYKLTTNFVDITIKQTHLKIWLNLKSGQLNDPFNLARDLTKPHPIGHWGNGDYEIKLKKEEDLDKVFELIKQSYEYNR